MKELFITCPPGFESLLQEELQTLGIESSIKYCGVAIPKKIENVYIANYCSRVATRVLWPLASFRCLSKESLYEACRRIDWSCYLNCDHTFAIDANVQHPTLKNSLYAALVVKDAICDYFRDKTGRRPSVDITNPDLQLNLFIRGQNAHLYLDTSGSPLHKRGWRKTNTEATLHESLAAALLLGKGYQSDHVFCDPFCGSGTFLIEAAMIATNTPSGFFRKRWGFFHLPEHKQPVWQELKQEKNSHIKPLKKEMIFGSDKSRESAEIAKLHAQKAGFGAIEIQYDSVSFYTPRQKANFIMTNPPYGKRLEASALVYNQFGTFLQEKCASKAQVHVVCPSSNLIEHVCPTKAETFSFKNGGLPVYLHSFYLEDAILNNS